MLINGKEAVYQNDILSDLAVSEIVAKGGSWREVKLLNRLIVERVI